MENVLVEVATRLDIANCALEPIHIPGLIQPHAMLLAIGPDGTVSHASANLSLPLCRHAADALGRPLGDVLGPEIADLALAASEVAKLHLPETAYVGTLQVGDPLAAVMISAHRYNGSVIIDLEVPSPHEPNDVPSLTWLYELQSEMLGAADSRQIGGTLATALQSVTGYDSVMVYEFDEDWHGHVVGQARREQSGHDFLDLHFPASDIPAQARELYQRQLLRVVVDSHEAGIPVLSAAGTPPLDMSFSSVRSVSPVHLEYLRNMGVRASTVASILKGDRLWGLVVGHHYSVRRAPSLLTRQAIQVAAMLTGGILSAMSLATTLNLTHAVDRSIERVAARLPVVGRAQAVVDEFPALAEMLGLDGIMAQLAGDRMEAGAAMPWVQAWSESQDFLLAERFPETVLAGPPACRDIVGGALLRIGDEPGDMVILGRVEYARVVTWGGDPTKPVEESTVNLGRLRPRHSFERWKQFVEGRCRPFTAPEAAAIALFHQRLRLLVQADNDRLRRERAQQIERLTAIGLLAGGVAHDLNNLLGVISLNLDIALEPSGPAERQECIQAALTAVESGSLLTSALLSFARRQTMTPVDIDPVRFLPEFCSLAATLLGGTIAIEVICDDDIGLCHADVAQLQTALLNLTVNARDSMKASGGRVTISAHDVTVTAPVVKLGHHVPAGAYVALSVQDTGPGMEAERLRRAADPFFTTKPQGEGIGLGLPMVLGFATQSGGALTLLSNPGRGTTATILLPRLQRLDRVATPHEHQAAASKLSGLRLLVLEDRSDLSGVIGAICRKLGLKVTVANSASSAIALLVPGAFDIVLSDIMPDVAGLDVPAHVQRLMPPVPILLMTDLIDVQQAGSAGPGRPVILLKPFQREELIEALGALALSI